MWAVRDSDAWQLRFGKLGVPHGAWLLLYSGRRFASFRPCLVRGIRGLRPGTDIDRESLRLGLGTKHVVSIRPSGSNRYCRIAIVGRCYLPTYYLGNVTKRARWRRCVLRLIHFALVGFDIVFSGSSVGILGLLHRFRCCRRRQLVLGSAATLYQISTTWSRATIQGKRKKHTETAIRVECLLSPKADVQLTGIGRLRASAYGQEPTFPIPWSNCEFLTSGSRPCTFI